jgi:hypothetical protein
MTSPERKHLENLAAPCGLYCGACSILAAGRKNDPKVMELIAMGVADYLGHPVEVKDLACEGCHSDVVAIMCRECELRACALLKGLTHCSQCADFPCQQIIDFNNDDFRHHSKVLDNIRRQRDIGIDAWIKEQDERWRCPKCDCVVELRYNPGGTLLIAEDIIVCLLTSSGFGFSQP